MASSQRFRPSNLDEIKTAIAVFVENEEECLSRYGEPNSWDISGMTTMAFLFMESKFNGDISNWDVSNVNSMIWMFDGSHFNGDISQWDVSNVKKTTCMFQKSQFNGDISNWDVSKVKIMSGMFYGSQFNGDISKWDVSNVEFTYSIFEESQFSGDISEWDISKIKKGKEEIFERVMKCKMEKASKIIQDWWMEILLNPHHPVGKNYLHRQAVKVCDY